MTKLQFLLALHERLSDLPHDDVEEQLSFYSEMIEDRTEEGMSEEEAVAAIGDIDVIVSQIAAEISPSKAVKEAAKPKRRLKAWEIVLLAVGSPIWLSLLVAALVVAVSVYVVLWSLIVSLWAVFGALVGCAVGGIVTGVAVSVGGRTLTGIALIAAAVVCAGLSIFLFFGCKAATKGTVVLTKTIVREIKKCLIKKEARYE